PRLRRPRQGAAVDEGGRPGNRQGDPAGAPSRGRGSCRAAGGASRAPRAPPRPGGELSDPQSTYRSERAGACGCTSPLFAYQRRGPRRQTQTRLPRRVLKQCRYLRQRGRQLTARWRRPTWRCRQPRQRAQTRCRPWTLSTSTSDVVAPFSGDIAFGAPCALDNATPKPSASPAMASEAFLFIYPLLRSPRLMGAVTGISRSEEHT